MHLDAVVMGMANYCYYRTSCIAAVTENISGDWAICTINFYVLPGKSLWLGRKKQAYADQDME